MADSDNEGEINAEYTTAKEEVVDVPMKDVKVELDNVERSVKVEEAPKEKCIKVETCDGHITEIPITKAKAFDRFKFLLEQEEFDLDCKWPLFQFDPSDKTTGTSKRMTDANGNPYESDMTKEDLLVCLRLVDIWLQGEMRYITSQSKVKPVDASSDTTTLSVKEGLITQKAKDVAHSSSNDDAEEKEEDSESEDEATNIRSTKVAKQNNVSASSSTETTKLTEVKSEASKAPAEIALFKKWPTYERDIAVINAATEVLREKGIQNSGFTLPELARLTVTTKFMLFENGYRYVIAALSNEILKDKWENNYKRMKKEIEHKNVTDQDIKNIGEKISYIKTVMRVS